MAVVTTFTAGYTCGSCGAFVSANSAHSCSFRQPLTQVPADPTWPLISALQRVELELRRIADALEAKQP